MPSPCGGFFEYDRKKERLEEVSRELEEPTVWSAPERAQELGRERARLVGELAELDRASNAVSDAAQLLELAESENDESTARDIERDAGQLEAGVRKLEFKRMFRGAMDAHSAFLDIQAGAGGTEAQDWAQMLLRMYLRWGAAHGFVCEVIDSSPGEVAGMKSATVSIQGEYAYGWLRTETGVHRLVRKSPFDSGNRRHTSFASVFVSPEVDESIDIEINPADLMTPADIGFGVLEHLGGCVALVHLEFVQLGLQHLHGGRAVLVLAALVLASHHDAAGQMRDAHRRLGLVDMLAAGAARAIHVHPQIRRVDLDIDALVDFR